MKTYTKQITFTVTSDLFKQIKSAAKKHNISVALIAREAIEFSMRALYGQVTKKNNSI